MVTRYIAMLVEGLATSGMFFFRSGADQWIKYTNLRNSTSRDYSGGKAKAAIKQVGDFVNDAIELYKVMSGKTWK